MSIFQRGSEHAPFLDSRISVQLLISSAVISAYFFLYSITFAMFVIEPFDIAAVGVIPTVVIFKIVMRAIMSLIWFVMPVAVTIMLIVVSLIKMMVSILFVFVPVMLFVMIISGVRSMIIMFVATTIMFFATTVMGVIAYIRTNYPTNRRTNKAPAISSLPA